MLALKVLGFLIVVLITYLDFDIGTEQQLSSDCDSTLNVQTAEGSLFETLPFDIASKYFTSLDYDYEKISGNSDNLDAAW